MHAYRSTRAFDGRHALRHGALVLVEGSTIVGVEPASATGPDDCPVTELDGTTLLPGLIDTHVHLCGDGSFRALEQLPELDTADLDAVITTSLRRQLSVGVTAVRDLGDMGWAVVDRHRGPGPGPTVVAAGPPITSLRGHCWWMGGVASGTDQLRRAVRERAERGADVVKIMASGGLMSPGTDVLACQFTLDDVRAVVAEAHMLGLPVTAHAHGLTAVQQCCAAGVDGIEHCTCVTEQGCCSPPALAAALATAGIQVCPTLGNPPGVEPPPAVLAMLARSGMTREARLPQVAELRHAGVTLVSGTDGGISPGKPHGVLAEAVIDLVACGAPVAVALASATSGAAQACGLAARTGRLAVGLDADLLAVNGDLLADVTALRHVRAVISRGRPVGAGGIVSDTRS